MNYRAHHRIVASSLALGAALVTASCGSDDIEVLRAGLSEGCVVNSDCAQDPNPLICAFRLCHVRCNTSADCEQGLRCVLGDKPSHVCLLRSELGCTGSSGCAEPLVCAQDGECRDGCRGDRDCVSGQKCTSGVCADSAELVNGALPNKLADDSGSAIGQPCAFNSDCPGDLVCQNGRCDFECRVTKDCPAGFSCTANRCVSGSNPPKGDAASGDGGPCVRNSDCAAPAICLYGSCELECRQDIDCAPGRSCVASRCAIVPPAGAPAGYGNACTHSSSCPSGTLCSSGACVYECLSSVDCAVNSGFCCVNHSCIKGGALCTSDAGPTVDAALPDGATGKLCGGDLDCQDAINCNGIERCEAGRCTTGDAPCDDKNPCTTDTCNEASAACTHASAGPQDLDGDGHFAIACGSGADDCDDVDPTVYPGAKELCDGIDNNCNGTPDEGIWTVGARKTVASSADDSYKTITTTLRERLRTALVRLGDGTFRLFVTVPGAAGDYKGTSAVRAFTLDAALASTGQTDFDSAPAFANAQRGFFGLSAATNGTNLVAFGTSMQAHVTATTIDIASKVYTVDAALSSASLTSRELVRISNLSYNWSALGYFSHAGPPTVAWNGSEFVAAWVDMHDYTYPAVYAVKLGSGALPHLLSPNPLDVESFGGTPEMAIAFGPNNALVAWSCRYSGAGQGCWALTQKDLSSINVPATVNYDGGSTIAAAVYVGGAYVIVEHSRFADFVRLRRIDASTGAELAQLQYTVVDGYEPRVATFRDGLVLTVGQGSTVRFAVVPADLKVVAPVWTNIPAAGTVSNVSVSALDDKSFGLAWIDGSVRTTAVSCAP